VYTVVEQILCGSEKYPLRHFPLRDTAKKKRWVSDLRPCSRRCNAIATRLREPSYLVYSWNSFECEHVGANNCAE